MFSRWVGGEEMFYAWKWANKHQFYDEIIAHFPGDPNVIQGIQPAVVYIAKVLDGQFFNGGFEKITNVYNGDVTGPPNYKTWSTFGIPQY